MSGGIADDKPREPMTALDCFVQTCYEALKKRHPDENIVFAEFSKKCEERWKTMVDKEKKYFHDMAEKDKERYATKNERNSGDAEGKKGRSESNDDSYIKEQTIKMMKMMNSQQAEMMMKLKKIETNLEKTATIITKINDNIVNRMEQSNVAPVDGNEDEVSSNFEDEETVRNYKDRVLSSLQTAATVSTPAEVFGKRTGKHYGKSSWKDLKDLYGKNMLQSYRKRKRRSLKSVTKRREQMFVYFLRKTTAKAKRKQNGDRHPGYFMKQNEWETTSLPCYGKEADKNFRGTGRRPIKERRKKRKIKEKGNGYIILRFATMVNHDVKEDNKQKRRDQKWKRKRKKKGNRSAWGRLRDYYHAPDAELR